MDSKTFTQECLTRDLPNKDYSPIANRLSENKSLLRTLHAGIGISGEAGEIIDSIKKSMMYGKTLDVSNLIEECGDLLWYMAILLDENGSSFEQVMAENVAKLRKRYPQGFTEKDAIDRKDKAI